MAFEAAWGGLNLTRKSARSRYIGSELFLRGNSLNSSPRRARGFDARQLGNGNFGL